MASSAIAPAADDLQPWALDIGLFVTGFESTVFARRVTAASSPVAAYLGGRTGTSCASCAPEIGQERNNVKKACTALSYVRRAARSKEKKNFGRELISLVVSLCALGVFGKERSSRSPALNALCRRAADFQLRC